MKAVTYDEAPFFNLFNVDFRRFPTDTLFTNRRTPMMKTQHPIPFTVELNDKAADFTVVGTYTPGTPATYHLHHHDPAYDPLEVIEFTGVYFTDLTDRLEDWTANLQGIIRPEIDERLTEATYDVLIARQLYQLANYGLDGPRVTEEER